MAAHSFDLAPFARVMLATIGLSWAGKSAPSWQAVSVAVQVPINPWRRSMPMSFLYPKFGTAETMRGGTSSVGLTCDHFTVQPPPGAPQWSTRSDAGAIAAEIM